MFSYSKYASIIEHETLKAEIILCPTRAYFGQTKIYSNRILTVMEKNHFSQASLEIVDALVIIGQKWRHC